MASGSNKDVIDSTFENMDTPNTRNGGMFEVSGAPQRPAYVTRQKVVIPRSLPAIEKQVLIEADLAGEEFFYAWGTGKDRIEGISIEGAMILARHWGNCHIAMLPLQETFDAFVSNAVFIDLETGFTYERQHRQSKRWEVFGKFDEARKEDIRFGLGQSKAARNVILRAMPSWLKNKAITQAKEGVRNNIQKVIEKHGVVAYQDKALAELEKLGITEQKVLDYFDVANRNALDIDKLVEMKAQHTAIKLGEVRVEDAFVREDAVEDTPENASATDSDEAKRKILDALNNQAAAGTKAPTQPPGDQAKPADQAPKKMPPLEAAFGPGRQGELLGKDVAGEGDTDTAAEGSPERDAYIARIMAIGTDKGVNKLLSDARKTDGWQPDDIEAFVEAADKRKAQLKN